jgi:hypothetical protein
MLLIMQDEMGGAFGSVGEKKMHKRVLSGNRNEGDHLEDPDVDDRIVLKLILNKSDGGGIDYICLVQDRDKWWDVLNKIISLWVA